MERKVLVYDSQEGYYNWLKSEICEGYKLYYFDKGRTGTIDQYDILIFFLHEELELIEYMQLYQDEMPVLFCCHIPQNNREADYSREGNTAFINLSLRSDMLLRHIQDALHKLTEESYKKSRLKAG